jgi:hypothetical protein
VRAPEKSLLTHEQRKPETKHDDADHGVQHTPCNWFSEQWTEEARTVAKCEEPDKAGNRRSGEKYPAPASFSLVG